MHCVNCKCAVLLLSASLVGACGGSKGDDTDDKIAPTLTVSSHETIFKDKAILQFTAEDEGSTALPKIYINEILYQAGDDFQITDNGTTLKVYAEDASGNRSAVFQQTYIIDKQAPEISVQPAGEELQIGTEITVLVSDDTDATPTLEYSIDGGSLQTYSGALTINQKQQVLFVATDNNGRETSLEKNYSLFTGKDTQAPVLKISSEDLIFKDAGTIQFTVSDNQDSSPIIMLNDQLYIAGSDILITENNTSLSIYAEDASGNRSETITKQYQLDLQKPELTISPDGEVFSGPIDISLSATDDTDDLPTLYYSIDGGDFEVYNNALNVTEDSNIEFKAVDNFERITLISKSYKINSAVDVKKPVIYQLVVRYFGNTNTTNKIDGTLEENGSGKFNDINDKAISELKKMGFTHIYLTGVIQQSTATDYSDIGQPADDADILKGLAGSFFAIKDYFDVSPDYAVDPAKRIDEFKNLVDRIHSHGMKVMIDFVPNHVSRNYETDIKPQYNFGSDDDQDQFFSNQNNFFYYLDDSNPLRLPTDNSPTCGVINSNPSLPNCDQSFARETGQSGKRVKVTGLDDYTSSPGVDSWYETVKINYGYNFKDDYGQYSPQPKTWGMMNEVIKYWQDLGVDGFRTDFSHVVPNEFWQFLISKAKARQEEVLFMGEAYTNMNGFRGMFDAGFDYLYDDDSYDLLKDIFRGSKWANDIDKRMSISDSGVYLPEDLRGRFLRYAENHDEKRLPYEIVKLKDNGEDADPNYSGFGTSKAGIPVSTVLYTLSSGPVMMLNGQEVGEPAAGQEGFDGDDGHSSIFDYWSMPEFRKWVNNHQYDGGQLSLEQQELRAFYSRLLPILQMEAITEGAFYGLNWTNNGEGREDYGNKGQYLYSYIRHTQQQQLMVVVNFSDVGVTTHIIVPKQSQSDINITQDPITMTDLLVDASALSIESTDLANTGLPITLDPLSAKIFLIE